MSELGSVRVKRIRRILGTWARLNSQRFPWRSRSAGWHGLVAEILLQRTRARQVLPVYLEFVRRFPTPKSVASARLSEIRRVFSSLGLHWRAKLLHKLGLALSKSRGNVPDSLNELLALPGVGPYAASAWLSFHRGRRAAIVDSNTVRWLARVTGRAYGPETRRSRWVREAVEELTPSQRVREFNYGMLDFTMLVCRPKPRCEVCPFAESICRYAAAQRRAAMKGERLAGSSIRV